MVFQDCFIELQWVNTYSELVWLAHGYHVADPLCWLCDPLNNSHVFKLFNFVLKLSFHWYGYSSWIVLDWFYRGVCLDVVCPRQFAKSCEDIFMFMQDLLFCEAWCSSCNVHDTFFVEA